MVRVRCSHCPQVYQVPEERLGTQVTCKKCQHIFTLQIATDATAAGPVRTHGAKEVIPRKVGQYVLQRKLGSGAMGDVWLARDTALDRDAAVKLMTPGVAADQERRQRFEREAKTAARLQHPNTVGIYSYGIDGEHAYLAMELVAGASLDRVVSSSGPLPWREATRAICDAARGLAAAHEIGLVHRDVKPANLMRTAKGATKVVDFGLAREMATNTLLTQEGSLMGTPAFMAPEQWMAGEVDGRTDLYSLVCTYYFLLTGRLPYTAPSLPALGYQHRYEPLPDPRQAKPDLPDAVCRILARGTQKLPADRYQSGDELVADLESLLAAPHDSIMSGAPWESLVSATGPALSVISSPIASTDSVWRNKALFGAAAGAAVAALLLFGIVIFITAGNRRDVADRGIVIAKGSDFATNENLPASQSETAPVADNTKVHLANLPQAKAVVVDSNAPPRAIAPFDAAQAVESASRSVASEPSTAKPSRAISPFDAAQARKHQQAWADYLKLPLEQTNSVGMKFVLIPPGEFSMGSSQHELEAALAGALARAPTETSWHECVMSEGPQHRVVLTRPFYLALTETTQWQYEQVMGKNPSDFSPQGERGSEVAGVDTTNFPVENVSWNDAAEFCAKLSEREKGKPFYFRSGNAVTPLQGNGYRLPTEAEWEFACRAGTTTMYWTGDSEQDVASAGWNERNSRRLPRAVQQLSANPFGLFDVHGSMYEWVQDWWDPQYYEQFPNRPAFDPAGPVSPPGPRGTRVLRGGAYGAPLERCRSAHRYHNAPGYNVGYTYSFRVALTVEAVRQTATSSSVSSSAAAASTDGSPASATAPQVNASPVNATELHSNGAFPPAPNDYPAKSPPPAVAPFTAAGAQRHQNAWATYLGVPLEYSNGQGMKFRLIPPGEFMMGSSDAEIKRVAAKLSPTDGRRQRLPMETPLHRVMLTQAFYLGIHEVTQQQYEAITGQRPSALSPEGRVSKNVVGLDTSTFPVESVSWNDAVQFCMDLSVAEKHAPFYSTNPTIAVIGGPGYRLPTEAEWEFACRAGTQTAFWTGDSESDVLRAAWCFPASRQLRTTHVGSLAGNPFGLFDVHGNLWEWCHDAWDPDSYKAYEKAAAVNPVTTWDKRTERVVRGGHFHWVALSCRSAARIGQDQYRRFIDFGFRAALSVEAVKEALDRPDANRKEHVWPKTR